MFLKKPTIAAKGILGSFNEIFLLSASLTFPQNRSIPLFSPRCVGEHPALEPIQEDQFPLAFLSLFSLLCSRELARQLAGVPETRQVICSIPLIPSQSQKDFFLEKGICVLQPGKCVFCTLFHPPTPPNTHTHISG